MKKPKFRAYISFEDGSTEDVYNGPSYTEATRIAKEKYEEFLANAKEIDDPEELENLPENHEARKNPNILITRSSIEVIKMPIFTKVINRTDVIFNNADPIVEE